MCLLTSVVSCFYVLLTANFVFCYTEIGSSLLLWLFFYVLLLPYYMKCLPYSVFVQIKKCRLFFPCDGSFFAASMYFYLNSEVSISFSHRLISRDGAGFKKNSKILVVLPWVKPKPFWVCFPWWKRQKICWYRVLEAAELRFCFSVCWL